MREQTISTHCIILTTVAVMVADRLVSQNRVCVAITRSTRINYIIYKTLIGVKVKKYPYV